ncbi:alpha-amylase 1 [Nitrosomonas stercoris]|uniref:Alpha-amylase 1 n=1 Tax=Nitrosomonas stercoris TaxID=1444684 RepID=A0A4Y1YQB5_9PROT|nr:alpha-amylase 1 [Nitrosomonas stercoris]
MPSSVSLLLGVHAHQPIGNFPEVVIDAHERCYQPFLHTLHRYPEFRFSVHFSGWLLNFLLKHYPKDMALLREMVKRGQIEVFGAGDTEPVLAAIPERDRIGQLKELSRKLKKNLGQTPRGAWLTERVWEPTVTPALARCGIHYVMVDDYHFYCAGKNKTELNGYYTTEEDHHTLDLFPISEAMRYRLPFSPATDAIAYIESLLDQATPGHQPAAIYFDDIEKFGIWPETYQWVYEQGWLEQFIQGVLASPHIQTQHYRDYHASEKTRGIIYLPTTSYIEMNEWTLLAEPAHLYDDLVQQAKSTGQYEHTRPFLRGGIWKNFFSRYPESNWMHKRMLKLSARYAKLKIKQRTATMQQHLYAAQANDAYWHGMFGGLYLPHLRRTIYNNLLALETLLDQQAPRPAQYQEDTDLDGITEIYLHNHTLQIVLKADANASICELDSYLLQHNFGDTLTRQTEHYYRKIQHNAQQNSHQHQAGIASAHDRISFKQTINPEDLIPDPHAQRLFIERLNNEALCYQPQSTTRDNEITFQATTATGSITKHFLISSNQLQVTYHYMGESQGHLQTEINLAMPSCDGPGGRYIKNNTILSGFGEPITLEELNMLTLEDDTLGGSLTLATTAPATLHAQSHYTVSQSEGGFEKIMQAVKLTLTWPTSTNKQQITLQFTRKK